MQVMKENEQDIEHGRRVSHASLDIVGQAMENLLHMADHRQQRERGFDHHTLVPCAFLAQFKVVGDTLRAPETEVRQRNGTPIKLLDLIVEMLVMRIHGQPFPSDDIPPIIEYPAQFDTYRPAPFILVLLAHLLSTAPFPYGKKQLNGKTIDDGEEGWVCQQTGTPGLMRFQQAQHTRTIWQTTEQRVVISLQPPVKGSKMPAFERKQNANAYQFTGIQLGLWMLLDVWHQVIDKTKDIDVGLTQLNTKQTQD